MSMLDIPDAINFCKILRNELDDRWGVETFDYGSLKVFNDQIDGRSHVTALYLTIFEHLFPEKEKIYREQLTDFYNLCDELRHYASDAVKDAGENAAVSDPRLSPLVAELNEIYSKTCKEMDVMIAQGIFEEN